MPGVGRGAFGIAAAIAPDTKGADAELHVGLLRLYLGIELRYEEGDVVAAPIVFAHALAIAAVAAIVAKLLTSYAVGVKVIVEVYGIYIVALYHVHNNLKDIGAGIRIAWVYEGLATVANDPVGVLKSDVGAGIEVLLAIHQCTEGIEPCVKFHIALVRLLYHELQGIVIRERRLPLPAGEVMTPGLDR